MVEYNGMRIQYGMRILDLLMNNDNIMTVNTLHRHMHGYAWVHMTLPCMTLIYVMTVP